MSIELHPCLEASAIRNITGDFRIGFGSFVDKEVAPFISLVAEKNCQQASCPQPYREVFIYISLLYFVCEYTVSLLSSTYRAVCSVG